MRKTLSGKRINVLKSYGIDTSKFVGINAVVNGSGIIPSEYLDKEFELIDNKTIQEAGLYRRWVMAQTFHILKNNGSIDTYLKNRGVKYAIKMLIHELEVQKILRRNNDDNFRIRNAYFNIGLCKEVFNLHSCIGVDDVIDSMKYLLGLRAKSIQFRRINNFDKFITAYKEIGAYYTLQNMLLFHDYNIKTIKYNDNDAVCVLDTTFDYDKRKPINLLDNMLYCGKVNGIQYLSSFLSEVIEHNNINISEKIDSWRR